MRGAVGWQATRLGWGAMAVKRGSPTVVLCAWLSSLCAGLLPASAAGDVFIRFTMLEPTGARYFVRLAGYIHKSPWYLPKALLPQGADKDEDRRVLAGEPTPWFNFSRHAGKRFHGRLQRAGGVAELPNVTADFVSDPPAADRRVVIEIATASSASAVVKRFDETFSGSLTSFLISPDPRRDADGLECASQMTQRRLRWARAASRGKRVSPKGHIIQTSFWSPQRKELNLKEAEVLWLLGFNVVGNQREEVREAFGLGVPGHTHGVLLGPAATRPQIDAKMAQHASRQKHKLAAGVPFGFSDEIVCRPRIGENPEALAHFHAWLAQRRIRPETLGVDSLDQIVPIETPEELRERQKEDEPAARRVFYYTCRFRQAATTERLRWHTEAVHRHFGDGPLTSTLVADHPYFSGSGLGMGMTPNPAWGGAPLAADWFDLARSKAVDLIGIEDWMGLQYMYGPNWTWEGFQLMGFQAAIFRSASRGALPIIAWITPSDETNLRLKSASALCQGAKHFFYWTYGPTATSTENYWSDLRGAYDGIASVTRQLAAAERITASGRARTTRLALLYSISSDIWQPFGYVHMLERRVTYLSLVHDQFLVDMLTEEDVQAGRLKDYDCLYVADPCVKETAAELIEEWVRNGGSIYGSCAAGSLNEFGEPTAGLSAVFGVKPQVRATVQPGRYHVRGALNGMRFLDEIQARRKDESSTFGVIGAKVSFGLSGARVTGRFRDRSPAVVENTFGKGKAMYVGACPAISYAKDAKFVPRELKETWPAVQRGFINSLARQTVPRLVESSRPVVETGVYDSEAGTALVLANFTYEPIRGLKIALRIPKPVKSVRSVESGPLRFSVSDGKVAVSVNLGLNDIILFE